AVEAQPVAWRPPVAGTGDALARVLGDPRRAAANAEAARRMLAAGATLVDVRPAREVVGLEPGQFCHAGPPIGWDRAAGPPGRSTSRRSSGRWCRWATRATTATGPAR